MCGGGLEVYRDGSWLVTERFGVWNLAFLLTCFSGDSSSQHTQKKKGGNIPASISYYRHRPWSSTVHETNQYLKKEQQILGYRSLLWYLKIWASSQDFLCRSLRLETRKTQARTRSSWRRARLWWNLKRWSHDSALMDFGKSSTLKYN